jgi:hypothetical protein
MMFYRWGRCQVGYLFGILLAYIGTLLYGQEQNQGLASGSTSSQLSSDQLLARALHRRAVEAVIWGMPIVNYDLMVQQMLIKTSGKVNEVIYWGKPLDWHTDRRSRQTPTRFIS